jgi:hypothetical protein
VIGVLEYWNVGKDQSRSLLSYLPPLHFGFLLGMASFSQNNTYQKQIHNFMMSLNFMFIGM